MVKGVGRMVFDDYDEEFGYSLNELTDSYSRKAYAVSDYELRSLGEIEHCIVARKYTEKSECVEHEKYLADLQKRLTMILLAEEREGIMNWELREFLQSIRKLAAELSAVAENFPSVVVYKEKAPKPEKGIAPAHPVSVTHPEPIMS